jgi:hypothetical protein
LTEQERRRRRCESTKAWIKKNPVRVRRMRRNRTLASHGLTQDDFEMRLVFQRGRCGICTSFEPGKKGWHIDHSHQTGLLRQLLCSDCNTGIGKLKDSPETLRRAANYIETWNARHAAEGTSSKAN